MIFKYLYFLNTFIYLNFIIFTLHSHFMKYFIGFLNFFMAYVNQAINQYIIDVKYALY